MTAPFRHDLTIWRGATFEPVGWVVLDDDGRPARSTYGLEVVAKMRRYAGADDVLHTFACSVQMVTYPGQYDDQAVAVAQIDGMTPEQTAALTFDRGVYGVMVSGEWLGGGRVSAPLVVAR